MLTQYGSMMGKYHKCCGCNGSRGRNQSPKHCFFATRIATTSLIKRYAAVSQDSASETAIYAQNVSYKFGDKQVLRSACLNVPKGSLHILAGANGCGKSTLLRILGGLLPLQEGRIRLEPPVGIVLQNPDQQLVMPTVAAEVAFGLGRYRLSNEVVKELVQNALHAVNLADIANRPTLTLSGGQKQRVAIAAALAQSPKVLLLDELTTFLDAEGQQSVISAVRRVVHGPRKVTALWITHRLEEIQWADGASFIEDGRIAISGDVTAVQQHLQASGAQL